MDIFTAIADPTRRAILDLLRAQEIPAGEIVSTFPALTQPAISRHLRVLREVGLVSSRVQAQQRLYSIRPEGLAEVDAWLARYRTFWVSRLDALALHLDTRAAASSTAPVDLDPPEEP